MRGGAAPYAKLQAIDDSVFVAPSAQLYGKISIGEGSSVWHNAVARAECREIEIGRIVNIQDFVMIHVGYEAPTRIGDFCSITHHATVHGCVLGDACLVGPGAIIMDGAVIGAGSIVAGGAVVPEGKQFPRHSILAGVPAKQIGERDSSRANRLNAWQYHRNAEFTRRGDYRCWEGAEYAAWLEAKQAEIERDADL
ncbi:MAG: gamma carbonic anhydrase family protein [Deltaproteobacteria bacterium]|nr:gamma carbonic anhydrase family protein [Deltaproteobacteria bacterium]MBW2362032.1 gamma carbonic anhydrase family protein [Deltaproteobacteria bacterium]